jgi:vacuolar-type H+-ATPase subunit H
MSDELYLRKINKYQTKIDRFMSAHSNLIGGGLYDTPALNKVSCLRVIIQDQVSYDILLDENAKGVLNALFCNIHVTKLIQGPQKIPITISVSAPIFGKCISATCLQTPAVTIKQGDMVRICIKLCVIPHLNESGKWNLTYYLYATEVMDSDLNKPNYLGCVQLISIEPRQEDVTAKILMNVALTKHDAKNPIIMKDVTVTTTDISSTLTVPVQDQPRSHEEKKQIAADVTDIVNEATTSIPIEMKEHVPETAAEAVKNISIEHNATPVEAQRIASQIEEQKPIVLAMNKSVNPPILESAIQSVRSAFGTAVGSVGAAFETASEAASTIVKKTGEVTGNIIGKTGEVTGHAVTGVAHFIEGQRPQMNAAISNAKKNLKDALSSAQTKLQSLSEDDIKKLKSQLQSILNENVAKLESYKSSFPAEIQDAQNNLRNKYNEALPKLQKIFDDNKAKLQPKINKLIEQSKSAQTQLNKLIEQQNKSLPELRNKIKPEIKKASDLLLERIQSSNTSMSPVTPKMNSESDVRLTSSIAPVKQSGGFIPQSGSGWWSSYN